tara:strand:+ start:129 stop:605 length:477 start_codon:yes stop_codon:yes gene_type:complete
MASILKVNTIQDATNSNTAISVDSSGRVTTPQRPAFQGLSTTKQSSGNYLFTSFSTSGNGACNRGGHFNASTGIFTAPIAGIYNFAFIFGDTSNSSGRKIGNLYFNDSLVVEVAEGGDAYNDIGSSIVMELSASDTISVGTHSSLQWGRCTFSGFLIG